MFQCISEFLSIEFAACSKPPSRDDHRNRFIQERNSITRVRVEPIVRVVLKTTPCPLSHADNH